MPDIRISHIHVDGYTTPVDSARVDRFVDSIKRHGLINHVRIRYVGDAAYLVAGRHRLEAYKRLGHETIPCTIVNEEEDKAELTRIAENLHRGQMTAAEVAAATDRYAELVKGLSDNHPGDRITGSNRHVAKETGQPVGTVAVHRAQAKALEKVGLAVGDLAGTSLDNQRELNALGRLPERDRKRIAERAIAGERVSAQAERQTLIHKGKIARPKRRKPAVEPEPRTPPDDNPDSKPLPIKRIADALVEAFCLILEERAQRLTESQVERVLDRVMIRLGKRPQPTLTAAYALVDLGEWAELYEHLPIMLDLIEHMTPMVEKLRIAIGAPTDGPPSEAYQRAATMGPRRVH